MTKWEFLEALENKLKGYPKREVEEWICFYSESIDDRIEEGSPEEEAVAQLGTLEEVSSQIIAEIPFTKIVKDKITARGKINGWEIILLVLGSPIWLSLLIAFFAVTFSLYAVAWSVVIAFWAVFTALAACGVVALPALVVYSITNTLSSGMFLFGCGLMSGGLAIVMFFVCKWLTKGLTMFTKGVMLRLKNRLVKKEKV